MKARLILSKRLKKETMIYFEDFEGLFADNGIAFDRRWGDSEEELIEAIGDAEIVLDMLQPITARVIDALPACKALIRSGIGVNNIDVEAATRRGIKVCNSPDHCVQEVATLALTLMLAAVKRLPAYDRGVKAGQWKALPPPRRVSALCVGLAGFGNIARHLCGYVRALGCEVIAYDPYLPDTVFAEHGARRVDLDGLFAGSDILSLHVPLLAETEHFVRAETIERMCDGVIVINTARGGLVCERDLAAAIGSGKVAAAGLDVFESEPILEPGHPLAGLEQVIAMPHTGYQSVEAYRELEQRMADLVVALSRGETPRNVINRAQLGE